MQISSRAGADPLRIERRHLHHPRPAPLLHHPKPAPQLGVPVRDSAREVEARICTQHRLDDLFLSMSWSTTARGARLLTVYVMRLGCTSIPFLGECFFVIGGCKTIRKQNVSKNLVTWIPVPLQVAWYSTAERLRKLISTAAARSVPGSVRF